MKLSLRQASRRAAVQPSVLSRAENGLSVPTMATLLRLSSALKLDIGRLGRIANSNPKKRRTTL